MNSKIDDSSHGAPRQRDRKNNRFADYTQKGKHLQTKFNEIREEYSGRIEISRWRDVQLPEYIWIGLIIVQMEDNDSIDILRNIATAWPKWKSGTRNSAAPGSHSAIGRMHHATRRRLIHHIANSLPDPTILRPLLLIETIPAWKDWSSQLSCDPTDSDWSLINEVLIRCGMNHTRETTDIYWFINEVGVLSGAIKEPANSDLEERRAAYPNNRKEYGGHFRAAGIAQRIQSPSEWPEKFWSTVWLRHRGEPCTRDLDISTEYPAFLDYILPAYIEHLDEYFWDTRKGSDDIVHEIAFGFMFYSAFLAYETVKHSLHTTYFGAVAIRTIAECTINMSYIVRKGDIELWHKYRDHGYGQARKIIEKINSNAHRPACINYDWVEAFSTEDRADYFIDINLGDWEGGNIRKRSTDSKCQDIYDNYFDYTSCISHGDWLAINLYGLTWDLNPLHRLQHIPRKLSGRTESVIPDLFYLLSRQIEVLNEILPGFEFHFPTRTNGSD